MKPDHKPAREYRTWFYDNRRLDGYGPRQGDIVVAAYPKCGTTWMRRIVGGLVFQTVEPLPFCSKISI